MGHDGHVASLFPGNPGMTATGPQTVIAVLDSPKPPPNRLSFTLATINTARAVWLVADGETKIEALAEALNPPPGQSKVPAGLVHGTDQTLALIDKVAASGLRRWRRRATRLAGARGPRPGWPRPPLWSDVP